ncbi:MAG: hypothetical protein SCALA701_12450 [Candidatus Scalindua sp.]|nr:hypothetical protein [Planctomycetota bacterium]RZV87980.1 MAG: hypothetical protein EX341_06630 [Candidatus Scalindua sp. SCAELEC01]GJQ58444.1 MAG: hypothetical protein SCALA701_12450 [Candidatus Scalindua sp.]
MRNTKTDNKNIALAKRIQQLRNDIDLHRLIGLNLKALKKSDISNSLLGHIQNLALGSIAVCICKIYEDPKRNELDSIPSIIESLRALKLTVGQHKKLTEFGMRYGNSSKLTDPKSYFKGTLGLFTGMHFVTFERMKKYRDKIGAHSESKVKITSLPSHDEFEAFFSFAKDFYTIVADAIINVGPAIFERQVGNGFFKLIQAMGIDEPVFDFEEKA